MKRLKKSVAFLLVLTLMLAMIPGTAAGASEALNGTQVRPLAGIEAVTDISIDHDQDMIFIKGTFTRETDGEVSANLNAADNSSLDSYDGSAYPSTGDKTFELYFNLPALGLVNGDGEYFVTLVDSNHVSIPADDMERAFKVNFLVRGGVVQPGWDTVLLEPSEDFTVGAPVPAATTAAVGTSVTFTIDSVERTSDGVDLQNALPQDDTLTYQWMFKGADDADYSRLDGQTGAAAVISDLKMADSGSYLCAVTYTEDGKGAKTVESPAASLTVTKGTPTITIVNSAVTLTYSGIGLNVPEGTATTNAAKLSYTYEAADGTASLEGGKPLTAGTYNVVAVSEEDDDYNLATKSGITLTVNPAAQVLTVTDATASVGSALDLTSCVEGAKGGLTFRVDTNTIGAALNADGTTLEGFTAAGTVTVFVKAAAVEGKYAASDEKSITVTVNEGKAVVVGAAEELSGGVYKAGGVRLGDIAVNPAPAVTAADGGAAVQGTWSWTSPETMLGAVNKAEQEATFTPNAASNGGIIYAGATAQIPVTIAKAVPELSLTLTPTAAAVGGSAAAAAVLAEADATGTITYASDNEEAATVTADGTITPVAKGTATITAQYPGDTNYEATSASAVFTTIDVPDKPVITGASGNGKLNVKWTAPADNGSPIETYLLTFKYEGVVSTEAAIQYEYNGKKVTTTGSITDLGGYVSGGALFISEGGVEYPVTTEAAVLENKGEVTVTKDVDATETTYEFSPAVNGLEYKISLVAVNGVGPSLPSDEYAATPKKGGSSGGGGGGGGSSTPAAEKFTVEFKAGSHGTLSGEVSISVEKDSKITKTPEVKAEAGYVFLGWSTDGKTVLDLSTYKVTGKATLTALYQKGTGYIDGYTDGTFRPDNNMTRAEVATVLAKLSKAFDADKTYTGDFSDVKGDWYAGYVNFAAANKVFSGYADGTFRPDNRITRAEFAACLANFMGIEAAGTDAFADTSSHWAAGYIAALKEKNVVSGYQDNTFKPENSITRAEVVTMLNLALNVTLEGKGAVAPSDVTSSHWAYDQIMTAVNADLDQILK